MARVVISTLRNHTQSSKAEAWGNSIRNALSILGAEGLLYGQEMWRATLESKEKLQNLCNAESQRRFQMTQPAIAPPTLGLTMVCTCEGHHRMPWSVRSYLLISLQPPSTPPRSSLNFFPNLWVFFLSSSLFYTHPWVYPGAGSVIPIKWGSSEREKMFSFPDNCPKVFVCQTLHISEASSTQISPEEWKPQQEHGFPVYFMTWLKRIKNMSPPHSQQHLKFSEPRHHSLWGNSTLYRFPETSFPVDLGEGPAISLTYWWTVSTLQNI